MTETFNIAPACKVETVWRLSQKWLDAKDEKKPTTTEEWKALLDRLTDYMGGMIKQSFYLTQNWETFFPEPEGWDEDLDSLDPEKAHAVLRHEGHREALRRIEKRHSEVYDDLATMICGR